jgi:hypothetical protein
LWGCITKPQSEVAHASFSKSPPFVFIQVIDGGQTKVVQETAKLFEEVKKLFTVPGCATKYIRECSLGVTSQVRVCFVEKGSPGGWRFADEQNPDRFRLIALPKAFKIGNGVHALDDFVILSHREAKYFNLAQHTNQQVK